MKLAAIIFIHSVISCTAFAASQPPPQNSAQRSQPSPSLDSKLDKRIRDFRTSGRPLITTLLDLAYEHQLPVGIEYVDREAATRPIDLEFHGKSLRDILLAVVAQLPEYRLAFSSDVVEVYSPQMRENPSDLLNRTIKEFSVVNVDTRDADLELACSLSRELKAGTFCGGSIAVGQWGPLKITVHLQNAKVYEIANAIIAQNGKAVWTVIAPPDKLSTIPIGGLWHIYPLEPPFKEAILDKVATIAGDTNQTAKQ